MLNSTTTQQAPSKSSLTITLTEPLVFLRPVDSAGAQSLPGGFASPSVLRGLLALDLSKASRISSIEVELQASSFASWSEVSALGSSEEHRIFSATQVFFRAPSSPSARRSLSVDPGVSHYANESEQNQPPPPPFRPTPPEAEPTLTTPAPIHAAGGAPQRGRMRVRRRSSADHLVFQRDPVAHLNRPAASSPLSLPPATEEEVTTPTSTRLSESPTASTSAFAPVGAPLPAHIHPNRYNEHSRAASLGDAQTQPRASNQQGRSATTFDGSPSKGHRSHPSLGICSIFGRGSRPSSPVHDEDRPDSPQSNNSRERGREKSSAKRHPKFPHHALGKVGEALRLEDEHKEVGDGWQEFRKGTYTFPIFFEIPSRMPASLACNGGSVTWKLVAKVRRPGVFTSNLTAVREVQVVSIPADPDFETSGDIVVEKPWDDQLHYLFKVSGKAFAIGGSFHVKMMFMPLSKIRLYKLAVDIEERVDSFVSGVNMTRTVTSNIPLLNLQHDDETKPLLPLDSSDPLAYENSPLAALRPLGSSRSDQVSQLLGPGPWPVRAKLYLPADCGVLHPTSRSRESPIHVAHALRFTMRLARGDDAGIDSRTGKSKLFEVVVRTPVRILSCYARAEYTTLPRYSETLDESTMLAPQAPKCPCAAERERRSRKSSGGHRSRSFTIESSPATVSPAPPFGEVPRDLLERTLAYERLVSGHDGVMGDAPPAYNAEPAPAMHAALHSTAISV